MRWRRARRDGDLSARIAAIHCDSRGTYGVPRIHAELAEDGERVARKRVARLMRAHGLRGVSRRKWTRTTLRDGAETPVPDLVERDFTASRPNALWVADATYIPTWEGFLFLAVVVDVCSRRVVGWSMGSRLVTSLMLDALDMELGQRDARGVIHHSSFAAAYRSVGRDPQRLTRIGGFTPARRPRRWVGRSVRAWALTYCPCEPSLLRGWAP